MGAIALLVVSGCASGTVTSAPTTSSSPPASARPEATASGEAPDTPPPPAPTSSASPTPSVPIAWRELQPEGGSPQAREDGTWTADPRGRVAYLFGGRDGGSIHGDLWAFDLDAETWTALSPDGAAPAARFGHEAVWVDDVGMVVFAGQAGPTTFFNDLWAYDPDANRWRALTVDGVSPKARYGTCAALGADGRLWISHGFTEDGTRFADTQAFDFGTSRWSDVTPAGQAPVSRCLHGCWWTDDGRFALYAGQTTGVTALGDLWTQGGVGTDAAAWTRATADLPADRNLYAFARHGNQVIVVGGRGLDGFLDDGFAIDATSLAIELLEPEGDRPPGRAGAMLIDDPARGRVVLFGGKNDDGAFGDLWALSLPE